ncbi:MAG: Uma2 family endonuclease [Pyrinomonadaceae bacterium]
MVANITPLVTVADLDATPDDGNRYELIGGELLVLRALGIPHQRILQNLQVALSQYLSAHPSGMLVPGAGVIFDDYDAVIPDLIYVSEERLAQVVRGDRFVGAPDLLVEVMSPGTENRQRDLVMKRQLYGRHGVREYWVIDPENLEVEVYRLSEQGLAQAAVLSARDELTTALLPDFRLSLSTVFKL